MLHRDLDVVEADLFEQPDLVDRRLDQCLWHRRPVLVEEVLVERSGVHPHPDRHPGVERRRRHRLDVLRLRMLPGLSRSPGDPGLERRQRQPVLEVDVGDDGHRRPGHDLGEPLGGVDVVAGDANDVGTGSLEGVDLSQRPVDVGGLGGGHRLDRDRGPSPDGDIADLHWAALPASDHEVNRRSRAGVSAGKPDRVDQIEYHADQPDKGDQRDHHRRHRGELADIRYPPAHLLVQRHRRSARRRAGRAAVR